MHVIPAYLKRKATQEMKRPTDVKEDKYISADTTGMSFAQIDRQTPTLRHAKRGLASRFYTEDFVRRLKTIFSNKTNLKLNHGYYYMTPPPPRSTLCFSLLNNFPHSKFLFVVQTLSLLLRNVPIQDKYERNNSFYVTFSPR